MIKIKLFQKFPIQYSFVPIFFVMSLAIVSIFPILESIAEINKQGVETTKFFGVNYSGAEFGDQNLPGKIGTDYIYGADEQTFKLFNSKGLTVLRVPFRWERLQNQNGEDLNSVDVEELGQILTSANNVGSKVILDMHNYGSYYSKRMETKADIENFASVWKKIAESYKNFPGLLGYELMNEPHDLPGGAEFWKQASQAAIYAIRTTDKEHYIFASGYDWQSAQRWQESNKDFILEDPAKKLIYSAHCYFDKDSSGRYENTPQPEELTKNAIESKIQPFLNWLKEQNAYGFISEYGIPNGSNEWRLAQDDFLNILENNQYILGATAWSAGPWWGNYNLSLQPETSKNKLSSLEKHPTIINAKLKNKVPVIPNYIKDGSTLKFDRNPTIYLVRDRVLFPFSNFESYSMYIKESKARLYFLRPTNHTIKMRFAEDLLYFSGKQD